MRISIAYAEPHYQFWQDLDIDDGATVAYAIERSGILGRFPEINLEEQKIGVFGKVVKLDATLSEGDRLEIYRPITADPETVPRKDGGDDDDEE